MNEPQLTPEMIEVLHIQEGLAKKYPQALAMDLSKDPCAMEPEELTQYMDSVRKDYEGERAYWNRGGVQVERIEKRTIVTRYGDVPVEIFYPVSSNPNTSLPMILYAHGGGYIVGSNRTHHRILRSLAVYTGMIVIGIEYSLSPEAKFPLALHQCTEVALWAAEDGKEIGGDSAALFMAGDSCGASLSLGVALRLREQGMGKLLRGILLLYGGYGLEQSESRTYGGSQFDGMTQDDIELYNRLFLTKKEDKKHKYNALLANDFSLGLPPACILCSTNDPLIDDNLALVAKYQEAGLAYEYHEYKGILHGFLHYQDVLPESDDALKKGATFLRQLLI